MIRSRLTSRLTSDFATEWCALAVLTALDIVWARAIHFHLLIVWHDAALPAAALAMTAGLKLVAQRKGAMMAEYFVLTVAATAVFSVLSYLCLASSGALVDGRLMAIDHGLGFDWLAGYRFLLAHPIPAKILQYAYDSLVYQGLYFGVLLSLMDKKRALTEMFWLVLIAGLFTSAGAWLFPALGPFQTFHAAPAGSFLPEMQHLRSGQALNFALAHMTGVVSFPSFHTAMALAYVWGFRRTGPVGWIVAGLNIAMLAAIPWFGGHYLIDMIAGAGVMAISLAIVKAAPRFRFSAGCASPISAAASDGAC